MATAPNLLTFPAPSAPVSLTEKYCPKRIQDFCGIAKVKETMLRFCDRPFKSAWTFVGKSGTGKTSIAHLVAQSIDAELIFVPSQECTADRLRWIVQMCQSCPMSGQRFTLVLVDEADLMSKAARDFLLSTLDHLPTDVIFIFTCNSTEAFEGRFLSRTRILEFSNNSIQADAVEMLTAIWETESAGKVSPNIARIVKDAKGNIRASLMALELELLLV